MWINSVHLCNFRNISYLDVFLTQGMNIFFGQNAQGKTNILEAIEILSTTCSSRTRSDTELIKYNYDFSKIKGIFQKKDINFEIEINYFKNKKKLCIVNDKKSTFDSIFGKVNIVKFFPNDVEIITGSPAIKRRFLDMEISLIDRNYYENYKNYLKIISERNKILNKLSEINSNTNEYYDLLNLIDVYDNLLPDIAYKIYIQRVNFLNKILNYAKQHYKSITSNNYEFIDAKYKSFIVNDNNIDNIVDCNAFKQEYTFLLKKTLKNDIIKKFTSLGPHKDDVIFLVNGMPAKAFASTGQIKTFILAIKIAQIDYIFEIIKEFPIFLIDDLTSELDYERICNIINNLSNKMQIIITSTNVIIKNIANLNQNIKTFKVIDGNIKEENN